MGRLMASDQLGRALQGALLTTSLVGELRYNGVNPPSRQQLCAMFAWWVAAQVGYREHAAVPLELLSRQDFWPHIKDAFISALGEQPIDTTEGLAFIHATLDAFEKRGIDKLFPKPAEAHKKNALYDDVLADARALPPEEPSLSASEVCGFLSSTSQLGDAARRLLDWGSSPSFIGVLTKFRAYQLETRLNGNDALACIALYFANIAGDDPHKKIPLRALSLLPYQGPELYALAKSEWGKTPRPESAQGLFKIAKGLARSDPQIAALLDPGTVTHAPMPKPTTILQVPEKISIVAAQKVVTPETLLQRLSYDTSTVDQALTTLTGPLKNALDLAIGGPPKNKAERFAALVTVLHSFSGDLTAFTARYGRQAESLVCELARGALPAIPNYVGMAAIITALRERLPAERAREVANALVRHDGLIPKRIGVLDRARQEVADDALRGRKLIAVQHLFPTLVPLVEAYIKKGMKPEHIHILGTPYASNPLVVEYLRLLGCHCEAGVDHGGNTRSFEEERIRHVEAFLTSSLRQGDGDLIVLDDGGMLNQVLGGYKKGSPELEHYKRRLVGKVRSVEQTTRGLTELKKFPIPYPVVTVANAFAKTKGEGELIGWALAEALHRELLQVGGRSDHVTVVSAGTVGMMTAKHLQLIGKKVTIVDIDKTKLAQAKALGFQTAESLGQTDVIFSCTGKTALDGEMIKDFTGVVASGSSAAIEFDTEQLSAYNAHFTLLNRGRPLNFQGDGYENLNKDQIGLTRALLFLAVCQNETEAGMHALADGPQMATLEYWKQTKADTLSPITTHTMVPPPRDGSAHDEWMCFLRNSTRGVFPRVDATGAKPGMYFYEASDGSQRFVDTVTGISEPSPLTKTPTALFDAGTIADPPSWLALSDGKTYGAVKRDGQWLFGKPQTIDKYVATRADDHSSISGPALVKTQMGHVFEQGDSLVLYPPGKWDAPVLLKKALGGDSLFSWIDSERILQCEKRSGKIGSVLLKRSHRYDLDHLAAATPFASIDAIQPRLAFTLGNQYLIGKDSGGFTLVQSLSSFAAPPIRLPKGAIVRDIKQASIFYAMPGEGTELEQLHEFRMT
jgi:S-adenosylhomocysteine hydrolase